MKFFPVIELQGKCASTIGGHCREVCTLHSPQPVLLGGGSHQAVRTSQWGVLRAPPDHGLRAGLGTAYTVRPQWAV